MAFLLWLFISSSLRAQPELQCRERIEMGTPFKICVFADPKQKTQVDSDLEGSFEELRRIDAWMSEWRENTELSRVNAAAGKAPREVSNALFELAQYALRVAQESGGAFDPTFNAFWGLYRFKEGDQREATDSEIQSRLPLVNYRKLALDEKNRTLFLKEAGMKLGFGGLGQGYGVDQVVPRLKEKYSAGFVDGSGDTYFWGQKPSGELWITAVRDPRDKSKELLRVYGTDFAITTCGDDEKFFFKNGRRVHHILDPKTGRPSTASRQITVLSRKALYADAWDTASFVIGPQKAFPILRKQGMEAVGMDQQERIFISEGLVRKETAWGEVYEFPKSLR